jgi:acetoin utilization protein AcuC
MSIPGPVPFPAKPPDPLAEPLVVYGEANHAYDFGDAHPFTPRRFGPGIDLLRALGATRFAEPVPVTEAELETVHRRPYIELVRMLSDYPEAAAESGFDDRDTPPFYGMHDATAGVVGGTVHALDRILAGDVVHAFHPGGGLHHAFPSRAGGFCVYNDLAVAIRRARDTGQRVLYVDIDVHHGDGVEAIFWDDPLVQTISFHQSGLTLFPGSGFVEDRGGQGAEGSAVNIPLEPGTSDASWIAAIERVVPRVAAVFRPTLLVTAQGCDGHVLDPLSNLALTTNAFHRAARLLDDVAHRRAGGRWLATGAGGYEVYRVVPRSWALVWLAQAHRDVPAVTPSDWRERWSAAATRHAQGPPPVELLDPPGTAPEEPAGVAQRNGETAEAALEHTLGVLAARHGPGSA